MQLYFTTRAESARAQAAGDMVASAPAKICAASEVPGKRSARVPGGSWSKMQMDVILVGANATTFTNLKSHSAADNISGCKIFGSGRIARHEGLALAVS